jgi:glyoxylase-like metal-dependent hydrolase (beta-lactamase superfamily II)
MFLRCSVTSILKIPLAISNAFLLMGDRAVLVDAGRPSDADAILRAVRRAGVEPGRLSLLLHTHAHWDHCGATRRLKEETGAPAAVHRADADMMRRGDNGSLRPTGFVAAVLHPILNRPFPAVEPDILLDDETDLQPYGVEARAVSTPGHTAGSISVITTAGDAIIGDLLMGGFLGGKVLPRLAQLHYYAEDLPTLWASVQRLLGWTTGRVFTSHGGPLTPDSIRRLMRRYI